MASYIDVSAAITEAEEALAAKEDVLERINMVRADLRHALKLKGGMTDEQRKWIEETFPERTRTLDPAVKADKLRKELAEAEKRQAEAAKANGAKKDEKAVPAGEAR